MFLPERKKETRHSCVPAPDVTLTSQEERGGKERTWDDTEVKLRRRRRRRRGKMQRVKAKQMRRVMEK